MRKQVNWGVVPALALACMAPAHAQQSQSNTAPDSEPKINSASAANRTGPRAQLEEVVVTAQRRSQTLQHTAAPVDVISSQTLLQSGVTTATGLSRVAPSLIVTPAGGGRPSFFLRGVGNFTSDPLFDSAVAFNYDNIYVGKPGATSGFFYDLQRIEVLKGPQGTLYGRNATGGAINVLPVHPELGKFSGYLTTAYGNYNTTQTQGAVNVPLGPDTALRLSGTYNAHDAYLNDGTSNEKVGAARVQLLQKVNEDLTIRAAADFEHVGGNDTGSNYANRYTFNPATGQYVVTNSGLGADEGLYSPASQAYRQTLEAGPAGRPLSPLTPYTYDNNKFWGVNGEIDYKTGLGTLTVLPAWRDDSTNNLNNTFGFLANIWQRDDQASIETRFIGNRIGTIDYTIGALFYHETNSGHYSVGQQALVNFQTQSLLTNSYSGYGSVTEHATDKLRLVGGVRFTDDEKSFSGNSDGLVIVCVAPGCPAAPLLPQVYGINDFPAPFSPLPPPGGVAPLGRTGAIEVRNPAVIVNDNTTNRSLTFRAAAEYDVAPKSLVYASVETGFRSGGFNLAIGYPVFKPEYITAYTIGSKNRFLNGRLQLNLEGFYWDYRDQQLAHVGLDKAGVQSLFTQNSGHTTNKGFDIDSRLLLTDTTALNGQLQYLDASYDTFSYQSPIGRLPPYVGCPFAPNPSSPGFYTINCKGKPSFNSPRWTFNIGLDQTVPLNNYKLVGTVDTHFLSSRYTGFDYVAGERTGTTLQTNLQVTFAPISDAWSVAAFVRNIEDNRYIVTSTEFGIGSAVVAVTAPPRTYGVRATINF